MQLALSSADLAARHCCGASESGPELSPRRIPTSGTQRALSLMDLAGSALPEGAGVEGERSWIFWHLVCSVRVLWCCACRCCVWCVSVLFAPPLPPPPLRSSSPSPPPGTKRRTPKDGKKAVTMNGADWWADEGSREETGVHVSICGRGMGCCMGKSQLFLKKKKNSLCFTNEPV